MTGEEICENLKTIITQIDETVGNRYEGVNATYIADIKPDSLRFVIEEAIKSLKLLDTLTDRPCEVCKYHKKHGCSRWNCVFGK